MFASGSEILGRHQLATDFLVPRLKNEVTKKCMMFSKTFPRVRFDVKRYLNIVYLAVLLKWSFPKYNIIALLV